MKRIFDFFAALFGLAVLSPFLIVLAFLVWCQDRHSPFYIAPRAGRGNTPFRMVKLRSMIMNADRKGGSSTSATDRRITPIGAFIRKFKFDEFTQLWNVLKGDMSLVGPRPQVLSEIPNYTPEELRLLSVRPGITDPASIVFADEGEILKGSPDPDLRYQQIIRPWKSRIALKYIDASSLWSDLLIIGLTLLGIVSRSLALRGVAGILASRGASPELVVVARRQEPLREALPP